MIPEAREVHLSRKDRKVLEAYCRSPVILQRDLKRARIVLLAAAGRSTRSIAKEVGVQPRIVSLWRHRFADLGLEGLQSKLGLPAAHNGCLPLKQNLMVLGGLPNPNQDYAGRSTGTPRASTQPAREDKKFSLASKNKIFAYLPRSLQRAVSWP